MKALSVRRLKELDSRATVKFGIPSLLLMENAAIACKEEITRHYPRARRFVVVCGPGNNGGDGFAISRQLHQDGNKVSVFYMSSPVKFPPDSRLNYKIVLKLGIPCTKLRRANLAKAFKDTDLIVDAIFGIGLNKEVGEPYRSAIRTMNDSGAKVVSVDIPSGLHADSGRVLGEAVRADLCVTFVAPKLGFHKARSYTGRTVVRAISVPLG